MCGISGIVSLRKNADHQLNKLIKMTKSMKRRGPDDEGYVIFLDNLRAIEYFGSDTPINVKRYYENLKND